ncbi:metallo-beta-lactamase family protein [Hyphomonas neptunium ATCC 15444]|uniref:Metallo-beta-lactamase family protein n=2 Tax=Hyphomonas TaxID=85 RepID=Q0C179_HYPNA|nr:MULTISPECIES: MBL fold metallo-hydrolase [Hyphomonas]ABI76745.1 metallo-beta-lactamase family protein [Hyphomonas neptunium ATCC 15444]KCZ95073.1 metallo-beta-lactamase family protein [Hyphomonas hirschiana VP5]
MSDARIILLGTGSSGGVPRVGGDWGACDPAEPKNRRRRCCALVQRFGAGDALTNILIDTSPDLREQLLEAEVMHLDAVIYTHDHADQSHGIDDVRALAIRQRRAIPVYFDPYARNSLMTRFEYCFIGGKGYPAILSPHTTVNEGQAFSVTGAGGTVEFLPVSMIHGPIPCTGYRIGNVAYCNDVNELPATALRQLGGLDVLIIDALRHTPHPSHAHLELALEWIKELRPKRAVLTNLHVDMDYQTLRRTLPANVEPGFDGMTISIES